MKQEDLAKTKLEPLKDADLTTRDRHEDIRFRRVVDAAGLDVGKIDQLLIDETERKVRFLRVSSGGFLGIGASKVLIPVEAITDITKDVVRVDRTRDHIAGSPVYDPELVDGDYYTSIYGHYGVSPYWHPGYLYPPYPHYSGAGGLR